MRNTFYTIGHSTRPIAEFIGMLQSVDATLVADVRSIPRSRTNPQYNQNVMPQSLSSFQIGYEHIAVLGGLRSKDRSVPPSINAFWQNKSFHNYADYAMGKSFHAGLTHLRELGARRRCAIMCSEALWWRCHRRIITDYLLIAGETVFHLVGPGQVESAHLNEAAQLQPSGALTYPAEPTSR